MKQFISTVKNSFQAFANPRTIAFAAMLIALNVILTRYFSIQTQFLRIGFGFLPVAIFSMLFGPVPGAIAAAMGDIIGFFLFPSGMFFPGFTFSAFMQGLIYGLFLYKKDLSWIRVAFCSLCVVLVVDVCLNTAWLSILYDQAVMLIIVPRLIKSAIMLIVQTVIVYLFYQFFVRRIRALSFGGLKK